MIGLFNDLTALLKSFTGHLQVVVPFSFGQLGEIYKARVLPLVVITNLRRKQLGVITVCFMSTNVESFSFLVFWSLSLSIHNCKNTLKENVIKRGSENQKLDCSRIYLQWTQMHSCLFPTLSNLSPRC